LCDRYALYAQTAPSASTRPFLQVKPMLGGRYRAIYSKHRYYMDILTTNKQYWENVKELVDDYTEILDCEIGNDVSIIISNNFKKDVYDYSSKRDKIDIERTEFPELNGILLLPRDEIREFKIIINDKQFNSDDFIHTVYHELTHYKDYRNYFAEFGNIYEKSEYKRKENYFYEFSLWSEYHAKKIGNYLYYIKIFVKQYGYISENWKKIISVDFQSDKLKEEIAILQKRNMYRDINAVSDFLNFLFGYYGRLSIFQENIGEYPDKIFPGDELIKVFSINVIKLYEYLISRGNYQAFIKDIRELRSILENICKEFDRKSNT